MIGGLACSPLVSIVIPTRNRPELLLRAIRSVLAQTFSDFEVIVVIDGQDPISESALAGLGDARVRSVALDDSVGGSQARNIGAIAATSPWIALLDDDDEWLPQKLDRQLAAANASSARHPFITSRYFCRTVGKKDTIRPRRLPKAGEPISEYMFDYLCYFQTSTLFCSRDLFLEVPFSPDLTSFQDIDWIFRLNRHPGVAVTVVDEPLAIYYTPEERVTLTSKLGWRERLRWGQANRSGMTARAYSRFIAGSIAGRAVQDGAGMRGFGELLRECIWVGSPTPSSVALLLGTFAVTPKLRRRIRDALFLSARRSQGAGRTARFESPSGGSSPA